MAVIAKTRELMKQLPIFLIFFGQALSGFSFCSIDSTTTIQLRVKNNSKYHIIKLTVLGETIENIKPGKKSDYFTVKPFYPSMKVDITFVKKEEMKTAPWTHIVTYPIDHVGEKIINDKRRTLIIEILKGETPGQFEINTWIK